MAEPYFTIDELESEEWREVAEFPDYAVSNLGRIKRVVLRRHKSHVGKIIKYSTTGPRRAYYSTHLRRDGRRYNVSVHILVALTFLGGPPDDADEVDHIDSNSFNNRASNLEWVTHEENCRRTKERGRASRGTSRHNCTTSEVTVREIKRLLRETALTPRQIAIRTESNANIVRKIKRSKAWAWIE